MVEQQGKQKRTRRERFLSEMDQAVPWARLVALIEPFYPEGKRGRPPLGVELMLRVYFLQQWYALADEALEDALYDSRSMRAFVGGELVPDATTLLKFRHLLERHQLTERLFAEVNALLAERGAFLREGTIVDATIIAAAPSTKNKAKERDPEMHQTKKGNAWHFGMKAHVGVDAGSGLVHTVVGTAANVADVAQAHALLHGEEKAGFGDAGYQGVERRPEIAGRFGSVRWFVAAKRSKVRAMAEGKLKEATQAFEKAKAQLRAYVEHPFHVVKNLFKTPQGTLPSSGQEHGATSHALRLGKPRARPAYSAIRNLDLNRQKHRKTSNKNRRGGELDLLCSLKIIHPVPLIIFHQNLPL